MNTAYRFAELPSNSSVAAFVTFAVSAWFLVAGAAIVADGTSPGSGQAPAQAIPVVYTAPAVAISPEARLIIVVEGRRA
jgi:hypothetical protein